MGKNHLKRITAPRNWEISRKERKWTTRPMPGAHPLNACLTLDSVIKDILKLGKTAREVNFILTNKEVLIDKIIRKDKKFAVGLMDVVEVPKLENKFRVCYNTKGELQLVEIDEKETALKLIKIKRKTKIKNGKIQVCFHDGRTIILDQCDSKIGDSALFNLVKKNIVKFIPLEVGCTILIVAGKNIGTIGVVKDIVPGNKLADAMCVFESDGKLTSTLKDYVFSLGKGKLEVTVEAKK